MTGDKSGGTMIKSSRSSQFADDMYRSARVHPSGMVPLVVLMVVAGVWMPHQYAQARPHDDRLDGGRASSQASHRLMKELKDFYKSDSYKNGAFTVELIDDNIYEWHVKLFALDKESFLHEDLQKLKKAGANDHILLHLKYNDNYPDEPPFVRVVYPSLTGILKHGAICMDLLGPGWNRNCTIEPLVVLIGALLSCKSQVRSGSDSSYTYEAAKELFDEVVERHLNDGYWTTTPAPQESETGCSKG